MNNRISDNLLHTGVNEELVRQLVSCNVKFIIIGGLAVAWHCVERQADDLDILIEPSVENSRRLSSALTKLQISGFSTDSFTRFGQQMSLKDYYYADLLTPKPDFPTYSEIESEALLAKLFNIPVLVASIPSLIAMKSAVISELTDQVQKHLNDITLLKKVPANSHRRSKSI
ncbi:MULTISPECIES: hypothetical protein [unclassified Pseudomonas]|uniref:hypothetical protein n=1 Tax=unclassified Pseudomonas TaxID=196821 RepID=UPI00111BE0C7|nr:MULTISPECIES: hypothetical protein [unclassified Pseudomonas]